VKHAGLTFLIAFALPLSLSGQGSLPLAAARLREAWAAHDPGPFVENPDGGVLVQIPGADPSSTVGRAQATELLHRYFRASVERDVSVAVVREVEPGRGYVELTRRYVVAGTADERRETVFLGLRKLDDRWVVTELRTGP